MTIKTVDKNGDEVVYKVKKTTTVSKIMNDWCKRRGVEAGAYRFLFDGTRLNGSETPMSLEMEDGDCIDVFYEQVGGDAVAAAAAAPRGC